MSIGYCNCDVMSFHCLNFILSSFGTSGMLCFVIMAFPINIIYLFIFNRGVHIPFIFLRAVLL